MAGDLVAIGDVVIQECPVSFIKPDTIETLQHIYRARELKEASGASLFGTDLSQWPDVWVYAFEAFEHERAKVLEATTERDR